MNVNVRRGAFADLLPRESLHRPSFCREEQKPAADKKEPLPSRPPDTMIAFTLLDRGPLR
jgi:hypothetical protein